MNWLQASDSVAAAFGELEDDEVGRQALGSIPAHIRDCSFSQQSFAGASGVASASPTVLAVRNRPSRLRTVAQILAQPPARYIIRDLLPERGLGAIYGAPGSGKSVLAIDMMFAVAAGLPSWFGRPLVQKSVAYIALEGGGGIERRIRAWIAHTGLVVPANLRCFEGTLSLLDEEDARELAADILLELGSGAVVVIDTLSRASSGGDENSSIDMTTVVQNAEVLGAIIQGPIVVVHHVGKETSKGMRGHSSLLGAVDFSIEVIRSDACRSWSVKKNKDGEEGGYNPFELVPYVLRTDQWSMDVRSVAVRPIIGISVPPPPPVTGRNKTPVLLAIRGALSASRGSLFENEAVAIAALALTSVTASRRNTVAKATFKSLISTGHLRLQNGQVSGP